MTANEATAAEWLRWGRRRLCGDDAAAEILLRHAGGLSTAEIIAGRRALSAAAADAYKALIAARVGGAPVAYLIGEKEFWSLRLRMTSAVLIARAESELLVECALVHAARRRVDSLLELGTGSGAIALALAVESAMAGCAITASDFSDAALQVARENYARLRGRLAAKVRFCRGDWFAAVAGIRFDMVIANPPYIAPGDSHLRGDLRFEPQRALVARPDGLAELARIIADAPGYLKRDGVLLVEHGEGQAAAVRQLFVQAGFGGVETHRDLGGRERVCLGRASP